MNSFSEALELAFAGFEIRFQSLLHENRAMAFPCDREGRVDLDTLGERTRNNYLFARAMIGREYAMPLVLAIELRDRATGAGASYAPTGASATPAPGHDLSLSVTIVATDARHVASRSMTATERVDNGHNRTRSGPSVLCSVSTAFNAKKATQFDGSMATIASRELSGFPRASLVFLDMSVRPS